MPAADNRSQPSTAEPLTLDDLLILLIEESGEVIQAATKCLRFGFNVDHGVGYGNNRMVLSREVGDLLAIIDALPLDHVNVEVTRSRKIAKAEDAKAKYGRATPEPEKPL